MDQLADKIEITELVNKLFMYCDNQQWQKLQDEVFTDEIYFDMTSMAGGEPSTLPAREVCDMWRIGFAGLNGVHHQAGHYLINIESEIANIYAYAVATHYREAATGGATRNFTGSYDLKAEKTAKGWRLKHFKYNLKFIEGNPTLE